MTDEIFSWIQPKTCAALFLAQRLTAPRMLPQNPVDAGSGRSVAALSLAAPLAWLCLASPCPA